MEESEYQPTGNTSAKERLGDYPIKEAVINGVNVQFVGVDHTLDFFHEHRNDLASIIHQSGLIIPEGLTEDAKNNGLDVVEKYMEFFTGVADLAKDHPGRITVVDPQTNNLGTIEAAIMAANLAPFMYLGMKRIILPDSLTNKQQEQSEPPLSKARFSRRDLMKAALLGAATYTLNGQGMIGDSIREGLRGQETSTRIHTTHGLDDTLTINDLNYRNTCVAHAIDKLTRERADNLTGPITLIYGAGHSENIFSLLTDNTLEERVKTEIYKPLKNIANQTIRDYEYSEDQWRLINEEPY